MNKSLFILVLFFALFSCKKDKLIDEKSILSGNWEWLYTQHSYGWCDGTVFYEAITPENSGHTNSISFFERGKIIFNKNESKVEKYRIVFESFVQLTESTFAFQLKLDNDASKIIEGLVMHDTLNIKYPFVEENPNCESYLNFFVRE